LQELRRKVTCMRMSHSKSTSRPSAETLNGSAINVALRRRAMAACVTLIFLAGAGSSAAADLSVMIVDREGHGVGEVVVTATPVTANKAPALKPAVMDQRNLAFAPRVLVVGVGTTVEFPNSDSVSHQVYSFSPAKRFQLPLYKGQIHPPVTFDRAGLVVLGCNIHDSMVGYIYVTDAAYFGTTESSGGLQFKDIPAGDYRVTLWSPFVTDAPASLNRTVHIDGNVPATTRVQLSLALRSRPEPRPPRRDWDY
jgi:plastocyanin